MSLMPVCFVPIKVAKVCYLLLCSEQTLYRIIYIRHYSAGLYPLPQEHRSSTQKARISTCQQLVANVYVSQSYMFLAQIIDQSWKSSSLGFSRETGAPGWQYRQPRKQNDRIPTTVTYSLCPKHKWNNRQYSEQEKYLAVCEKYIYFE